MSERPIIDALDAMRAAWEREASLPPLGSRERPYELILPGWMEDLATEQGTTLQEVADRTFLPAVRVVVVR